MTTYRALINDLDQTFKQDNGLAYKFLALQTLIILAGCAYSIILDLRYAGW